MGAIVKKGENPLSFRMDSDKNESFQFSFGNATVREIKTVESSFEPTTANSVFIPAKEVISLQDSIIRLYEVDKMFGFDKTYVDLARAMNKTVRGKNYKAFADARTILKEALGGRLAFEDGRKAWVFKDNDKRIIDLSFEGIKRLSI